MKTLKYILHVAAFMVIYILAMFIGATAANSRLQVYVVLGAVLALEYVYLWFVSKGRYFSLPLSFLPIAILAAFYFNHPSNPDMGLGMWVMAKYLVLPYAIVSVIVSVVMYFFDKWR